MIATTIDLDPLVFEENVYEDYKRKTFGPMFIHAGINNAGLTPRDQKGILYYLKRRANFLLFLGNPGLGKTHLCAALTYWAHTYFQSQRYWTEASIHKELIRRQGEGRAWQAELDEMMDYEFPHEWKNTGALYFDKQNRYQIVGRSNFAYNKCKELMNKSNKKEYDFFNKK